MTAASPDNIGQSLPAPKASVQKGVGLTVAAVAVGLTTAFSGVVIELASGFLSDLRHGVCVERLPGDTRPLWHATLGGGWRPYNRMRCCGGSASVDHATQECRAQTIISSATAKRFAYPLRGVGSFGHEFGAEASLIGSKAALQSRKKRFASLMELSGKHSEVGKKEVENGGGGHSNSGGHSLRASNTDNLVEQDAKRVRLHMSHVFAPDPTESWAEESATSVLQAGADMNGGSEESAVNEDVVQTQSESAGNLDPIYEWVPWDRALMAKGRTTALAISILGSALLALCAALVTREAIAAKGSGIPEVRASVAGFALPKHFQPRTLMAKVTALSFCVSSGLAVGKEGPMIHIGACWGSMLAAPISRIAGFSAALADTELICVGAAAGVSAAFGAPLAGVLFAVEELGTTMAGGLKYSTMLCAFGSAVVAALTLKWLDLTRTQRLTLFEVPYKQAWAPWEAVPFCVLGMVCGVLGGVFIMANRAVHRRRVQKPKDCFCWFLPSRLDRGLQDFLRLPPGSDSRVLEVVLLAIFTGISNWPRTLTRIPQNDGIFALFSQCQVDSASASSGEVAARVVHDPIGLCAQDDAFNFGILWLLLAAAALRFLQTTVTFGALVPSGLFVPSLFMGGCVGRFTGIILKFAGLPAEPGIYAMVGAGAMLSGVSRLTISLVVVLFELTGGLTYVVPFMLAVLSAKWVGDVVTDGQSVYDVHAEMSGLAKVEQSEDESKLLNVTIADLCDLNAGVESPAPGCGEVGESGDIPALWTSGGLARAADLATHCSVAAKGFVVLSADAKGAVEVLGWVDSKRVLAHLANLGVEAAGGAKAELWCRLIPLNHPAFSTTFIRVSNSSVPLASLPMIAGKGLGPGSLVEDLSDVLEPRGVVRIRHDCPVLTALCITKRCPSVHAFVSVDGPHFAARTVSRELFLSRLVSGRVRPLP